MSSPNVVNKQKNLSISKTGLGVVYPKVSLFYKTEDGLWRGFMTPYDVSFEAKTRKKVEEVLPKLVKLYEEGLQKYKNPPHLMTVPLSDKEDIKIFDKWASVISPTV